MEHARRFSSASIPHQIKTGERENRPDPVVVKNSLFTDFSCFCLLSISTCWSLAFWIWASCLAWLRRLLCFAKEDQATDLGPVVTFKVLLEPLGVAGVGVDTCVAVEAERMEGLMFSLVLFPPSSPYAVFRTRDEEDFVVRMLGFEILFLGISVAEFQSSGFSSRGKRVIDLLEVRPFMQNSRPRNAFSTDAIIFAIQLGDMSIFVITFWSQFLGGMNVCSIKSL